MYYYNLFIIYVLFLENKPKKRGGGRSRARWYQKNRGTRGGWGVRARGGGRGRGGGGRGGGGRGRGNTIIKNYYYY